MIVVCPRVDVVECWLDVLFGCVSVCMCRCNGGVVRIVDDVSVESRGVADVCCVYVEKNW